MLIGYLVGWLNFIYWWRLLGDSWWVVLLDCLGVGLQCGFSWLGYFG